MPHPYSEQGFGEVAPFEKCLLEQLDLCRKLEEFADSLPSNVDTQAAAVLAKDLPATLRRCHRLEETFVFPTLMNTGVEVQPILHRLRREHQEDEDHAGDVCDSIKVFIAARNWDSAGELGYMLRCLFMSLQRHLAFDRDHLLPLLRRVRDV